MKRVATALLILATLNYLYHAKSKDMVNIPEIQLRPHPETGELVPEVWVPVLGYEEHYKISNYCRVISLHRGIKLLKPGKVGRPGKPYLSIQFSKNGIIKPQRIHRICYISFFGESNDPTYVIDHKDNDRFNNFLPNLQRITVRENVAKDAIRKHNQPRGVYKNKHGWQSRVVYKGQDIYLGYSKTQEGALLKYHDGLKRLGIKLNV